MLGHAFLYSKTSPIRHLYYPEYHLTFFYYPRKLFYAIVPWQSDILINPTQFLFPNDSRIIEVSLQHLLVLLCKQFTGCITYIMHTIPMGLIWSLLLVTPSLYVANTTALVISWFTSIWAVYDIVAPFSTGTTSLEALWSCISNISTKEQFSPIIMA